MQYLCSRCRRPLQTGQTMCACGQLFDRVPEYNPNSPSNYWPWASASKPAFAQWLEGISPAMKASVFGGIALVGILITVGGSVHHYQSLQARYAPGTPVMAASAAPTPVQAVPQATPAATSMPAPVVMRAAPTEQPNGKPLYVPPVSRWNSSGSTPVQPEQSEQTAAASPGGTSSVDPNAVADASCQDAANVVQEASNAMNRASDAGSQIGPDWNALSGRINNDKAAVDSVKDRLSPEAYNKAVNTIGGYSDRYESLHQTWNQTRSMSQITNS